MKLIRNYQTDEKYLYNLTNDISESIDVSAGNEDVINEMLALLKTVGPCHDKKGKFVVFVKQGKPIKRTCNWFAKKNTANKCNRIPIAQIHCRLTCALKNSKFCKIQQVSI